MKTALQIAKNGDTEDRKDKEQARAEKADNWTDPSSANCSEDNPSRKQLVDDGSGKEREKVRLTREKAIILSSKRSKATKKSSWVDKDLKKTKNKSVLKREQNH